MIFAALLAFLAPPLSCHTIAADKIYGRDLAAAEPAFASLPPDLVVGFAAVPGLKRIFPPSELRRIAKENRLQADFADDLCFEWAVSVPSREAMLTAMNNALDHRSARIELIEQSLVAAPVGELVFPAAGLSAVSDAPVVWKGYVEYGPNRRFPVWARVKITIQEKHVVAVEDLRAGDLIRAEQLRVETYNGPLLREKPVLDLSQAVGMIPMWNLRTGSTITENLLEAPKDVTQGETVEVTVETDGACIKAQGVAEESGRRGTVITVHNVTSGRKFRARIEDKGKVLVVPGGPFGLVVEEKKS